MSNVLIPINFDGEQPTVSARDLHAGLGISERFQSWFNRQLQYGFQENTDYVGCKEFNTLAKILKQNGVETGQRRLFTWMRDNGYLIKTGSSRNMPTQKSMELGLFEIKETVINNPDGSIRISRTTKVTGKGQQYFINKFLT